jgi:phosphatidate cytidylyltransferase
MSWHESLLDTSPATRVVGVQTLLRAALLFAAGPFIIFAMRLVRRRPGAATSSAPRVPLGLRFATLVGVTLAFLAAAWLGELPFLALVLALVGVGLWEMWGVLEAARLPPLRVWGAVLGLALVASVQIFGARALGPAMALALSLTATLLLLRDPGALPARFAGTMLGVLFVAVQGAFLVLLRHDGFGPVVFFYFVTSFNDVFSLVGGLMLGRHKLAPVLSPGKTWEGVVAGLAAACVAAWAFGFALPRLSLPLALGLAILLAATGVIGGLVASAIKRAAGAKDFGRCLPGHGGIVDRFDTTLFSAPIVWLLLRPWLS